MRQFGGLFPEKDTPPWEEEEAPAEERPDPDTDPPAPADLILSALSSLRRIGDCEHLGAGYYLASPPRQVFLPSGGVLLIGGLPTDDLAGRLGVPVAWAGLARTIEGATQRFPHQDFRAWAALPATDLPDWTEHILRSARASALRCGGCDLAAYDVYSPAQLRAQLQKNRWISPRQWRPDARVGLDFWLCRTSRVPRRFWLAPLASTPHGPRFDREWAVAPGVVRRLMYGLDQRLGASVVARMAPVASPGLGREWEVRLFNWPSWEEYQLLVALAADVTPPEGPHLPMKFRVTDQWQPDVSAALAGIGISVRVEETPLPH
jgi:hypothetical protein